MSKLIGYARVSTRDQNPALQIDALKAAGVAEENIFVEHKSGKNLDRPELQKCLDALEEGDTLIVWKMDRLGRSLKDVVNIMSDLDEKKVGVNFLDAGFINRNTAVGKAMFNMLLIVAEIETDINKERTRAGLASARKRGKIGGRPKLKKSDESFEQVTRLSDAGYDAKEIAKTLGISKRTVYRRMQICA
jgi:DNA invertase Pin-like site-specific DNA recombinase